MTRKKKTIEEVTQPVEPQKIKSDGGSSDYYKIYIPFDRVEIIYDENDNPITVVIETEDIIELALDNDFDRGNLLKCNIRLGKKDGNDDEYELNKMSYSMKKIRRTYLGEPK